MPNEYSYADKNEFGVSLLTQGDCGTVSNCVIQGNQSNRSGSSSGGGGIYATGNSQILSCFITENVTRNDGSGSPGGSGAGVRANADSVLIRNCLITSNATYNGHGGGVFGGTIQSSTIVGNSVVLDGQLREGGRN